VTVAARAATPTLTVLTPVYNEEQGLPRYVEAVRRVILGAEGVRARVLFVDDGSRDGSWAFIRRLAEEDRRFGGIRLSRNFGSHIAISAGLACCDADAIATLACDLQDPPEVVLEFLAKWRAGADIVWGVRRSREDSLWRVVSSGIFGFLLRRFAVPRDGTIATGSFLLLDRRVVECVRQYPETNRIVFAIVAWTGFDQASVEYDRRRRSTGSTGWGVAKMTKTMYDAFIGFSALPIKVITAVAVAAFLTSFALAAYLLVQWMIGSPLPGWTSQMLAILVLFGIQSAIMMIMGQYLHRIYMEVVRRPLYFVSDLAGFAEKAEGRESPAGPGERSPVGPARP
jgi:dolichol-phosphate mannosyltransferase